jgi:hypothetical protein
MMSDAYFAARVVECGDCLRWIGSITRGGIGHPTMRLAGGKQVLVRRQVWEQANGPIPPGKIIRCRCETPLCVALEHLRLTTYRELALQLGALGVMSGPVRSARIAAVKRAGKQAKMSQDEARAIRASDESSPILSRRYGVSVSHICRIKRGDVRREFAGNVWAGLGA